jgi:predicted RNA binding protein YcfA (HicA-like mRNA interferase family)
MSKKGKLIQRLKSKPKDFTFAEMVALLVALGFTKSNKGRTSGSRVEFYRGNITIAFHRPHPQNTFKAYQIMKIIRDLEKEGLI